MPQLPWLLTTSSSGDSTLQHRAFLAKIRIRLFKALLAQDVAFYDENNPGVIVSELNESLLHVSVGIGEKFGRSIQYVVQFFAGYVVGFGWGNSKLCGAMAGMMPLVVISIGILLVMLGVYGGALGKAFGKAGGVAEESLSAIKTVQSMGVENVFFSRYAKLLADAKTAGIKLGKAKGIGMMIAFIVTFVEYGVGFYYGAILIQRCEATFAEVLTTVVAASMGAASLGNTIPNIVALFQARTAVRKVLMVALRGKKLPENVRKRAVSSSRRLFRAKLNLKTSNSGIQRGPTMLRRPTLTSLFPWVETMPWSGRLDAANRLA